MARIIVGLILSTVATVVLFVGAAMWGGMCHCMTATYSLFPYGTYLEMRLSSESLGLLLTFVQFPAYVLVLILIKGWRFRLGVALLLITLHIVVASLALQDYCQRRRSCLLRPEPKAHFTPMGVAQLRT